MSQLFYKNVLVVFFANLVLMVGTALHQAKYNGKQLVSVYSIYSCVLVEGVLKWLLTEWATNMGRLWGCNVMTAGMAN
jgi:hypothetical protein